jgi:hypothetical protein
VAGIEEILLHFTGSIPIAANNEGFRAWRPTVVLIFRILGNFRGGFMGARQKLNTHYMAGAVGAAGLLGLLTGSWIVAAVVGTLAVGLAISAGDIRLKGRR